MLSLFFFKQKTAYEMRISDWNSDVCSSDLPPSRIEMAGSFGNEMTGLITPLRPFGLDATAAFVDENRYHQARTWPFERDGNRLLLSGASRRVAPRPTERQSRPEERSVGQECGSQCRPRWSPSLKKKQQK